jgi:hypothetical protein
MMIKLVYLLFARLNLIFSYRCFTIVSNVITIDHMVHYWLYGCVSTILSNPLAPIAFQICAS